MCKLIWWDNRPTFTTAPEFFQEVRLWAEKPCGPTDFDIYELLVMNSENFSESYCTDITTQNNETFVLGYCPDGDDDQVDELDKNTMRSIDTL